MKDLTPHCPNHDARPPNEAVRLIVIHAISLPPDEFGGPGVEQLFTNALDSTAHPYYATIDHSFQNLLGPAKQLQTQYLPQIEQKAKTLDAGQIMAMVGGKGLRDRRPELSSIARERKNSIPIKPFADSPV